MNKVILPSVYAVLPEQENPVLTNIVIDKTTHKIEKIITDIKKTDLASADVLSIFENKTVMAGFIDPHVHFRTPQQNLNQVAENWSSASKASLFAGITTVLDMPNTNPSTIDNESYLVKKKLIQEQSRINYGIYAGLTSSNLEEVIDNPNFKAIKVYMASTTGNLLLENISFLNDIKQKITKPICFHSEKESIIKKNEANIKLEAPIYHSQIRSEEAAIESTKEIIEVAQKNKSLNFHVCHVSTVEEASMLIEANISFEVAPHHIFLNTNDYNDLGYLIKCNPPVRKVETANKLLQLLIDEKIPMIATDHAPHLLENKTKHFPPASGLPSIQVGTHYILDLVSQNKISASYASQILSHNTAQKFNIKNRGQIREGYFADLAIIDLTHSWVFQEADILSACNWSPFINKKFSAKVIATFVNSTLYHTHELEKSFTSQSKNDYTIYEI